MTKSYHGQAREEPLTGGIERDGREASNGDGVMVMQSTTDAGTLTLWLYASLVLLAGVVLLTLFQGLAVASPV